MNEDSRYLLIVGETPPAPQAGWTVARTLMIAPPFLLVGVPWKQAFGGIAEVTP